LVPAFWRKFVEAAEPGSHCRGIKENTTTIWIARKPMIAGKKNIVSRYK
jgi:hypothetical protein